MPLLALSLSTGEVILIVVFVALPISLATFVFGAGNALKQIGKGQFAVEFDSDLPQRASDGPAAGSGEAREAEIRQMLEAKAYRQRARGEAPLDIEAELAKLLAEQPPRSPGADPGLAEEVRQLVAARNERRMRQGQEPLDVDQEVERQLQELENLGQ
ncbi:MAG: hypothetical protein AABM42_06400 [Actinomycetota bacterium]